MSEPGAPTDSRDGSSSADEDSESPHGSLVFRGLSLRGVLLRLLFVMMVAAILLASRSEPAPEPATGGASSSAVENTLVLGIGRYLVGTQDWIQSLPAPAGTPVAPPPIAELEKIAGGSERDQVRLIVVSGELESPERALRRIEALSAESISDDIRDDLELLTRLYSMDDGPLEDSERESLVTRYGWFGELALVHGLDRDDGDRERVLRPARTRAVLMVVFFGVGGMAMAVGVVLSILALVFFSTGKLRWLNEPRQAPGAGPDTYLGVFVVFLGAMIAVSLGGALLAEAGVDVPLGGLHCFLLLVPLVLKGFGISGPDVRRALGWIRGQGILWEAGCGVVGYLACVPIIAVGVGCSLILIGMSGETPTHPIVGEMTGGGWLGILWLFVVACVLAPLVEETMFRGAFYHHLRQRYPVVVSGLVSGFIFAIIHPQGILAVPALTSIGFSLALLREWRGSLVAPVVAHGMNNAFVTALATMMFR